MQEFKGVSDKMADSVANLLNKSQAFKSKSGKDVSAESIIDEALAADGWSGTEAVERVHTAFNKVRLNINSFENLIAIQTDKNNPFRKLVEAGDGTNFIPYLNMVPDSFKTLLVNPEDYKRLLQELFVIDFKIGGISVGKGEVATTLISDAVKGKTGDLFLPGFGEVEFKDFDARMVGTGGGYAVEGTQKELNEILSQTSSPGLSERALQVSKKDVLNFIDKLLTELPESKKAANKPEILKYLDEIKYALDNDKTLQDLMSTIDQVIPQIVDQAKVVGTIKTLKDNIIKKVGAYQAAKAGKAVKNFSSAVKAFFSNIENLSDEQIARGIVACRNYNIAPDEQSALVDFLLKNIEFIRSQLGDYNFLKKLIAGLHIAIYKTHHNFKGIIFVTGGSKAADVASKKIIFFTVPGNTIGEKIINTIKFLQSHNVSISISVDNRGPAAQVSFNG
jgi:uncharacterized protein YukE